MPAESGIARARAAVISWVGTIGAATTPDDVPGGSTGGATDEGVSGSVPRRCSTSVRCASASPGSVSAACATGIATDSSVCLSAALAAASCVRSKGQNPGSPNERWHAGHRYSTH